jgi:hypothetical protein
MKTPYQLPSHRGRESDPENLSRQLLVEVAMVTTTTTTTAVISRVVAARMAAVLMTGRMGRPSRMV